MSYQYEGCGDQLLLSAVWCEKDQPALGHACHRPSADMATSTGLEILHLVASERLELASSEGSRATDQRAGMSLPSRSTPSPR